MVAFDFFWEEGFRGETFLFFKGSTSSLGGVTLLASVHLLLRHHPLGQVTLKESFLRCCLSFGPPRSSSACWFGCIMFFMSVLWAVKIRYLYRVGGDKEVNRPFLGDLLKVFFCEFII
jgi:hypothetical protein